VASLSDSDWKPVEKPEKQKDGTVLMKPTGKEFAEVCFVPTWLARSKTNPELRYVAVRERLAEADQLNFPGLEATQLELPFPVMDCKDGRYKPHGVVTNRLTMPGSELVRWHWERCGKSEEAHAVMKDDLAGGRFPSSSFGQNAAWWGIMILAFNLNSAMKRLVLQPVAAELAPLKPESWASRRLKALRFHFICLPGRVVLHARQLIIRVAGGTTHQLLHGIRRRILCLAEAT
jgi:hypothetical protein